jgi:hypothetical protein
MSKVKKIEKVEIGKYKFHGQIVEGVSLGEVARKLNQVIDILNSRKDKKV